MNKVLSRLVLSVCIFFLGGKVYADLLPPQGYYLASTIKFKNKGNAVNCPEVNVYAGDLKIPSKYLQSIKSKDVIDELNEAKYKEMVQPMLVLQSLSSSITDRMFKGKSVKQDLQCLDKHWMAWAKQNALLQPTTDSIGKAIRKWTLAAISSNYLKIKSNLSIDDRMSDADQQVFENWLMQMAVLVMQDYSNRSQEQINNHDYWAAWSVMATSVILNRQDMFDWSCSVYENAMTQIDSQGALPNELKRQSRALLYHNFSLQPLVLMAAFIDANGKSYLAKNLGALERLANFVIRNIDDNSEIVRLSGSSQVSDSLRINNRLAWLAPYISTYSKAELLPIVNSLSSLRMSRMGGDVNYIYLRKELNLADK